MNNTDLTYLKIADRLAQLRRKKKIVSAYRGAFELFVFVACGLFFLLIFEAVLWPHAAVRIFLLSLYLILTGFILFKKVIRHIWSLFFRKNIPDDDTLAFEAGYKTGIKDRLVNAVQIFRDKKEQKSTTSEEFAEQALLSVWDKIKSVDFKSLEPFNLSRTSVVSALLPVLLNLVLFVVFPVQTEAAFKRLLLPGKNYQRPQPFFINVDPGNIRVVEGDTVKIKASPSVKKIRTMELNIKQVSGSGSRVVLNHPFEYTLYNINSKTQYFFRSGRVRTPVFVIDVQKRPVVRSLFVTLFSPLYSGILPQKFPENQGSFSALSGSRANIDIISSKPLKSGKINFSSGKKKQIRVTGKASGSVKFLITKQDNYFISIEDTSGIINKSPIKYEIKIIKDMPPEVEITEPGADTDLDENMHLDLRIKASDDFGVSALLLKYGIFSGQEDSVEIFTKEIPIRKMLKEILYNLPWDIADLDLFPGDAVHYWVEVFDNDIINGPKKSSSKKFIARFPSLFDLYKSADEENIAFTDTLETILQKSSGISEKLNKLSDDLKTGKKLTWEQEQQIKQLAEEQKRAIEDLNSVEEKIADLTKKLESQNMLSDETLEKYNKLQNLMSKIDSPELKEALKKLAETVEKAVDKEYKIQDFQQAQKQFEQALDRTIALLKEIQAEQKIESLIRLSQDLEKRQKEINSSLQENPDFNELAKRENRISKDSEKLQNNIEDAAEMLKESHPGASDSLNKASDFIKQNRIPEIQKSMSGSLKKQDSEGSGSLGMKSSKALNKLSSMIQQAKKSLKRYKQKALAESMMRASKSLLMLSDMQESLAENSGSQSAKSIAGSQLSLIAGAEQISDSLEKISRKTFKLSAELKKSMNQALSQMNRSLSFLEQRNFGMMRAQQKRATASLNRAVITLQQTLNQMSGKQGQTGSSLDDFMQQLEAMGEQQSMINRMTSDLLNRGRLSLKEQAAMARLAQKQSALQKLAQSIAQELDKQDDVLGSLSKISDDMKKSEQDLKSGNISRKTKELQQRILSRLLDAQKSLHSRDFSNRRTATAGKNILRKSPSWGVPKVSDNKKITDDILNSARARYSPEYLKLIREYFEKLNKKGGVNDSTGSATK